MFDFEVRYVSGTKYIVVDGLSRRPGTKFDDIDEKYVEDINNFIIV